MLRLGALPFDPYTRPRFPAVRSWFKSTPIPWPWSPPTISTNILCRSSKLSPYNHNQTHLPTSFPKTKNKTHHQNHYLVFHIVHHRDHLLHEVTKILLIKKKTFFFLIKIVIEKKWKEKTLRTWSSSSKGS